ncbi:MAG: diguanylate cyclase [Clostridium sp.]
MVKQILLNLEKENERLRELVQLDWLTGLCNRGTTEKKINELLQQNKNGAIFVLDVDYFKQINDCYGHTIGDYVLQEIGKVLRYMVLKQDVVGRVGGDEFVIYIQEAKNMDFSLEKKQQFSDRIKAIQLVHNKNIHISVTIGMSLYEVGDDYKSLFNRADQCLITEKSNRKVGEKQMDILSTPEPAYKGIAMDINLISGDLTEQGLILGALCENYETFKVIYRFIERQLRRSEGCSSLILLSLIDGDGNFVSLAEREQQMTLLAQIIQIHLRLGDVFAQYSSCQFLLMVPNATENEADLIASRICSLFYERSSQNTNHLLMHHCYPMKPAAIKEPQI